MYLCHRGISDYFPENTLGSIFEVTKKKIYSGVEFDIQLTKDNKWIIYHDDNLLRLNNIDTKIEDINYSDINKITWKGNKFKVNLLTDLLEKNFEENFIFNIEIKSKFCDVVDHNIFDLIEIISKFKNKKFISSYDHSWFDIINPYFKFACITDDRIPTKGDMWVIHFNKIKEINILDLIESNIKIITFGNNLLNSSLDNSIPLEYQIVDEKDRKIIYINGTFDLLNSKHINLFKKAREYGNYLIVGVFDDYTSEINNRETVLSLQDRTDILENIKLIDKVVSPAPLIINNNFIQKYEIDIVIKYGLDKEEQLYKYPKDINILKIEEKINEHNFTLEIINRIFSFY